MPRSCIALVNSGSVVAVLTGIVAWSGATAAGPPWSSADEVPGACKPRMLVPDEGRCLFSDQCESGFCCPYLRSCLGERGLFSGTLRERGDELRLAVVFGSGGEKSASGKICDPAILTKAQPGRCSQINLGGDIGRTVALEDGNGFKAFDMSSPECGCDERFVQEWKTEGFWTGTFVNGVFRDHCNLTFFPSELGATQCPEGSEIVTDLDECKTALAYLEIVDSTDSNAGSHGADAFPGCVKNSAAEGVFNQDNTAGPFELQDTEAFICKPMSSEIVAPDGNGAGATTSEAAAVVSLWSSVDEVPGACKPRMLVPDEGRCLFSDQCESGFCCPYLRSCLGANGLSSTTLTAWNDELRLAVVFGLGGEQSSSRRICDPAILRNAPPGRCSQITLGGWPRVALDDGDWYKAFDMSSPECGCDERFVQQWKVDGFWTGSFVNGVFRDHCNLMYFPSELGATDCPEGTEIVTDLDECKTALAYLEIVDSTDSNDNSYGADAFPGCVKQPGAKGVFNKDNTAGPFELRDTEAFICKPVPPATTSSDSQAIDSSSAPSNDESPDSDGASPSSALHMVTMASTAMTLLVRGIIRI